MAHIWAIRPAATALTMVLPTTLATTLAALLVLAVAPTIEPDCTAAQTRLVLSVEGLRSRQGLLTIVVYGDRPEDFLVKGKRLVKARVPLPADGRICLPLPHAGTFALAAYHDEDGDGRFGRTWIGLPAEGYGFSNDPVTIAGIPTFDAVAFLARQGGNALTIRMRYP